MFQSIVSLLPIVIGADDRPRRPRHRRSRPPRIHREETDKWIWMADSEDVRNCYMYARKTFDLPSAPDHAVLKTSADSKYKLYVNGHYVGKGPVRSPGGYCYFDTYDITQFLTKGKNVIAFLIHSYGEDTYGYILKRPALICKAEIETGEEKLTITTDETWKVLRAPDWTNLGDRLSKRLGFQEVYDSSKRIDKWNMPKFNEKDWTDAVVVGAEPSEPWGELYPREIPHLKEEKMLPQSITGVYNSPERSKDIPAGEIPDIMADSELTELKAGKIRDIEHLLTDEGVTFIKTPRGDKGVAVIIDFGCQVFGNVEVGIAGSGTGIIDLGYGELLEDGRIKPNRAGVKYTDRILLNKGRLEWQGFEPRSFRYLQIEFRRCSKEVALEYIRINQTTYPVNLVGSFECSDNLLNDIWETGAYTTKLCMEDTYIDCPWRERAQWWGDARVESRVAYYAFDDTKLLAQGLKQLASSQKRDGSICGMYPAGSEKMLPDFSLYWIFSILDYYAFSDDTGLLRELYPNLKRLLKWFSSFEDGDGLLLDVPGWVFIDWADIDKRGNITALNCLYYQALRVSYVIASIIEKEQDAEEYNEAAKRLRMSINKFLYSPARGLYADCRVDNKLIETFSRQTNILAALFDIPDHYKKSTIYRQLLNGSLPELQTPFFASHLLEALYAGEKHEEALSIIRKKWGGMLKAGATTFWEQFNQEGSLCHGWSACPTRDLVAEYVGIKPVLGSHRFSIAPHVANLRWARGSIATKTGPLQVEWRINRKSLSIKVDVPEGLKVDVYPPGEPGSKVTLNGRSHPTRFVTIGAGSHRIRVIPPEPAEEAPIDESLTPQPYKHVEVYEDVSLYARRRTNGRRDVKPRRGRREKVSPHTEPTPQEEPMVVTLGTEEEPLEIIEITPAEAGEQAEPSERRKRRRRSRRSRRGAKAEPVGEATEPVEAGPAEEAPAGEVETEAEAEAEAEEAAPRKRSRRRPRRRSRSRVPEAQVEQTETAVAEPHEPIELSTQAEETETSETAPEEGTSRRRPRRRRGRSRSARTEEAAQAPVEAKETGPAPEPQPQPEIEAQPEETKPARRSRRRPRRKPGNEVTESVTEPTLETPAAPIVQAEVTPAAPEVPEQADEAQPKKPARRPRRRVTKGAVEATSAAEPLQAEQPLPPVEVSAAPAQPTNAEEPQPQKRTRRRRTTKAAPAEEIAPEPQAPAAEATAEPQSAEAEKPKRRRTYRRKKTEETPADTSESQSE